MKRLFALNRQGNWTNLNRDVEFLDLNVMRIERWNTLFIFAKISSIDIMKKIVFKKYTCI